MPRPEFTRTVDSPRLVGRVAKHAISAVLEERTALALRFGLVAIDRLDSHVELELTVGGLVRLSATLTADVVQTCVVTLEPIPATVEDSFTIFYSSGDDDSEAILNGDDDIIEPLPGGQIDIGEAVAQQLSLVLDPFPRAPQAELS
jgi:uncharacterized metal-binding protein YceD (DUF177 family)